MSSSITSSTCFAMDQDDKFNDTMTTLRETSIQSEVKAFIDSLIEQREDLRKKKPDKNFADVDTHLDRAAIALAHTFR